MKTHRMNYRPLPPGQVPRGAERGAESWAVDGERRRKMAACAHPPERRCGWGCMECGLSKVYIPGWEEERPTGPAVSRDGAKGAKEGQG